MSEFVVLLKGFNKNKKGTKGYLSDRIEDLFVFKGFSVTREGVLDTPDLFRIKKG